MTRARALAARSTAREKSARPGMAPASGTVVALDCASWHRRSSCSCPKSSMSWLDRSRIRRRFSAALRLRDRGDRAALVPAFVGAERRAGGCRLRRAARDARPFAALSNTALSMRDSIVVVARSQIGTRYRYGGTTPTGGFDCSGFVRYVLRVDSARASAHRGPAGEPSAPTVPKDTTRLRPGDLLTFGRGNRVTHIGIYVGNGRYVHASPTAGRVIETSLERTESPLVKIWRGGRRLLANRDWLSDSTAVP